MEKPIPLTILFAGIFIVSCVVQGSVWFMNPYVLDDTSWKGVIKETSEQVFIHPHFDNMAYPYGYPAVPILFIGGALLNFGVSGDTSLRLPLVLLIALGIALVGVVAYKLRPNSWWWLGAVALLMIDDLYYSATPPSSVVMPFIVAVILLTLLTSETRVEKTRKNLLVLLGVLGGFALSIRLDISVAVLGMSFLFLLCYVRRDIWILFVSGLVATVVWNPYLWAYPVEFFTATVWRLHTSYTTYEAASPLSSIIASSPFAMLTFCILLVLLFIRPKLLPVSRAFIFWLLGTTVLISGILLASPMFHPAWYFFPLFITWVVFLPLFVLALLPALPLERIRARLGQSAVSLCAIGLLVTIKAFFFLNFLQQSW